MDLYHKTDDTGPSFTRLLMDIEHLNLGVCMSVCMCEYVCVRMCCVVHHHKLYILVCTGAMEHITKCSNIVGVSKHLCGAATG